MRFFLRGEGAAQVLKDAAHTGPSVIWAHENGLSGCAEMHKSDDGLALVSASGAPPDGSVRLAWTQDGVPLFAEVKSRGGTVSHLLTLWSDEQRDSRRVAVQAPGTITWWAREGKRFSARQGSLTDLGVSGAKLVIAQGTPLPPTEGPFVVTIDTEGRSLSCLAEVRNASQVKNAMVVGLRFDVSNERTALADLCLHQIVPRLTLRRHVPGDGVKGLFARSGYLGLRDGCSPNAAWLGLDLDELSRDMVYMAGDGVPIGHVSITKAYCKTWLGHQIAMRADHPESLRAREDLYTAFSVLPTLLDGAESCLLGYYNLGRPWHQVFFTAFARWAESPSLVSLFEWDRFEEPPGGGGLPVVEAGDVSGAGEVSKLASNEVGVVTQMARDFLPPLLSEALDLRPISLTPNALHQGYERCGRTRTRTAFVLREEGAVAAFALCELSEASLSLFNIMNVAQMYVLPSSSIAGQVALFSRVRRFYAEQGVDNPLVVAPAGCFQGPAAGLRLVEKMGCIVWSGRGLRAYENYLRLRFAWLRNGIRVNEREPSVSPLELI